MGFIAIPKEFDGKDNVYSCKTDKDCFTAMKITDPAQQAKACCSYVGIDSMSDTL